MSAHIAGAIPAGTIFLRSRLIRTELGTELTESPSLTVDGQHAVAAGGSLELSPALRIQEPTHPAEKESIYVLVRTPTPDRGKQLTASVSFPSL